jgi:hypothetical protein
LERLLVGCMISKCDEIRTETYANIAQIVQVKIIIVLHIFLFLLFVLFLMNNFELNTKQKECLNVQVTVEVNSQRYKKLLILTLNRVFYQLIVFGLFDIHEKVKRHTQSNIEIK